MTRQQAINAKCRECTYDPEAAGTWREQVATCSCTDCALWRYRPLPSKGHAQPWVYARDPAALPEGWRHLPHETAVSLIRCRKTRAPLGTQRLPATALPDGVCA